jgi:hypothetical protein
MEKRLLIGVIGGTIAGILKDIPDALFHNVLKITTVTFWDYAGIITLGRHPEGLFEQIYSFIFEVIFSILLGIIFTYLTASFKLKQYLLWGGFYGAVVWLTIRAAVTIFNVKSLVNHDFLTAAINSLDSILYGIFLGYVIGYLEKKEKLQK